MSELTWKWGRFLSAGLASPGPALPAPAPVEPRPLAPVPGPPGKRQRKWAGLVLVLLLVVAVGVWTARRRQAAQQSTGVSAMRTATVASGVLEKTLRVSGTVGAKNFAAIVAPQMRGREGGPSRSSGGGDRGGGGSSSSQLILVKLAGAGTHVKKGDVIAQFDSQWELEHIDDHKARVIQTQALVDKRKAEIAIESEAHQQLVRSARADNEKAQLDLRTAEVRSAIDAEKLKLAVEETAARHKQLQEESRLKKLSHQSEIRGLEMQVQQEQHHVDRHNRNIQRMAMKAPIDGLVVMQSIFRSGQFGQVQEGDQVYPGTYFMQIVDLSDMVVNGSVNQADSHFMALGQRATVHLEAYPDVALPGRLTSIGAMATSGTSMGRGPRGARDTYVKQIPVRFSIDGKDKRVIPDLSASADVKIKSAANTLMVPREAVVEENGKTYAFVKQGQAFQKREIQLGLENNTQAVVAAGLSEGDEVALEIPGAARTGH